MKWEYGGDLCRHAAAQAVQIIYRIRIDEADLTPGLLPVVWQAHVSSLFHG